MTDVVFNRSLDQILSELPIGSRSLAISNNLFGINFRQTPNAVPMNKDSYGFTFFTRPQLNLTASNIRNFRGFSTLLTREPISMQRYTRMMLDPRLWHANGGRENELDPAGPSDNLYCPFVDPENIFIPVLTNNLLSVSGFPDLTVPTFTSSKGVYNEEYSLADGTAKYYEVFDLDCTFRNTKGSPIIYMMYAWEMYTTLVFEGVLDPYPDFLFENEVDYDTRIYRIILDETKRFVTYIAATGASFPVSNPISGLFDYSLDTPYNLQNKEITIRFKSMGLTFLEDILIYEFCKAQTIFNPAMRQLLMSDYELTLPPITRSEEDATFVGTNDKVSLIRLPLWALNDMNGSGVSSPFYGMNGRAYPWINPTNYELEWWVTAETFFNYKKRWLKNEIVDKPSQTDPNELEDSL